MQVMLSSRRQKRLSWDYLRKDWELSWVKFTSAWCYSTGSPTAQVLRTLMIQRWVQFINFKLLFFVGWKNKRRYRLWTCIFGRAHRSLSSRNTDKKAVPNPKRNNKRNKLKHHQRWEHRCWFCHWNGCHQKWIRKFHEQWAKCTGFCWWFFRNQKVFFSFKSVELTFISIWDSLNGFEEGVANLTEEIDEYTRQIEGMNLMRSSF